MKVTREESFKPVTIVLETQKEVDMLKAISGLNATVSTQVDNMHGYRNSSYFNRPDCSRFLTKIYTSIENYSKAH